MDYRGFMLFCQEPGIAQLPWIKEKEEQVKNLATIFETAKTLAMKESTIRKWIHQKRIPYVRVGARAVRVPWAWIEEQIQRGYSQPILSQGHKGGMESHGDRPASD